MQINRLFEIIYILLDKKTVTADYLANKFEVSRRTIYRDIETLSQSGIPIFTERGKNGGISILENFILDKSVISEEEQSAILTALAALSGLPNVNRTEIMNKLSCLFGKENASWISVDFSEWNINRERIFDKLKTAVIESHSVSFEYINSCGEFSSRTAEPLQLWFKGRAWYLTAYCRKAEDYRIFRLSRMRNLTVGKEKFERELPVFEYGYENLSDNQTEVTLRISPKAEYRVYDEFQDFQKTDDGSFLVKIRCPEDEWLYGYIMSFGEYAEVTEPLRIKEIIKEKLEKSLKNYI